MKLKHTKIGLLLGKLFLITRKKPNVLAEKISKRKQGKYGKTIFLMRNKKVKNTK